MMEGIHARLRFIVVTVCIGLVACSSGGTSSTETSEPTTAADGSASGAEATVTGTLVSSGPYAATWAWQAGNAADPGSGGITVTSDLGTFGNIAVLADGTITFSTGAPEISAGQPYRGTGAQVEIKNDAPCSFTLDNDVTGSDGTVLHLTGAMSISGGVFC